MKTEKTALITGAARGIGRGIALALAEEGFNIAAVDLNFDGEELQTSVRARGGDCLLIRADIAALENHPSILEKTRDRFGRLDCLVNNAGVAPVDRLDILETTPASYDRVMSVNARGAFFLTQKAARLLLESGGPEGDVKPCVIFITSISAEVSSPSRAEYCLSKAALSQTARLYADRLAEFGILVYEIRPGIIRTDMTAVVKGKYDKLIQEGLVPQGRWGLPGDIGRAAASLARGDFDYSTGLVLEVSGGMNIRRL